MSIVIAIVCVGIGNILALTAGLNALHRKLEALSAQGQRETRERAALAALHEAAICRAMQLAQAMQGFHETMVQSLRTQLSNAEVYVRVLERHAQGIERRAEESAEHVDAAAVLAQALHEMVGRMADEAAGLRALRSPPAPRRPPPALEPPGGASPMPRSAAAAVAAGLGPRPIPSGRSPAASTPVPRPRALAEAWHQEALGDDVTQVGKRSPVEALSLANTLPSMHAVTPKNP